MRHSDSCKRQAQKSNRRTGIRNGVRFAPCGRAASHFIDDRYFVVLSFIFFLVFLFLTLVLYCFDLLGFSFIFLFFLVVWFGLRAASQSDRNSAQREYFVTTFILLRYYFLGVALSGFKRRHFLCQSSVKTAISNHKRLII